MKLVSIIIPVYNAERYIRRCIDSVLSQTYLSIEVILINDGSTDTSGDICDEYAFNDARVRVFHKKNEGVSIARNVGMKEAQGDYITFLDADDLMKENCIANLMLSKEFPLVVCGYEKFGIIVGTDGPDMSQPLLVGKELADRWNNSAEGWWWFVWGKLYRKDVIINNDLSFKSDMIYLEDFCFVLDYLCCIDKIYLLKTYDVLHLIEDCKYSKYRMDYPVLKNHMINHENSFSQLEKKCVSVFEKMRIKIALRHIYNFEMFLFKSKKSFCEKCKNMCLYYQDKNKPNLFKYVKKEGKLGRRIILYWNVVKFIYIMSFPFMILWKKR